MCLTSCCSSKFQGTPRLARLMNTSFYCRLANCFSAETQVIVYFSFPERELAKDCFLLSIEQMWNGRYLDILSGKTAWIPNKMLEWEKSLGNNSARPV